MKYTDHYLVLLLYCSSMLSAPFYIVKNNNVIEKVIVDTRIKKDSDYLQQYHDLVIQLPQFIKNFVPAAIPFIAVVPDTIEGTGPLDDAAYSIEGARTVLAWIKSYEQHFAKNKNEITIIKSSDFQDDENNLYPFQMPKQTRSVRVPLDDSWNTSDSNKKCCLITGGAGFIGSHLAKKLLAKGLRVIVIDNLICSTGQNIADLATNPDFLFIRHDVSEPFSISTHVDYLIHAASIPTPFDYYKMPVQTMASGLLGTLNTLAVAAEHNARYLFASTSEVYGDPEVHPQVETYAGNVNCLSSRAPYDQSKRGAETLIQLFVQKYPLDVRIARIFNTYGPGMRLQDTRVVTNFSAALLENKPMIIYGDGTQTRSLCYIDDMVAGLVSLLFCQSLVDVPMTERVFNLGNTEEYTINQIAEEFIELAQKYLPYPATCKKIENPDKADPRKRKPDISRASRVLGFEPHVPFKVGLEKTFLYFMKQQQYSCNE